MPRAPRRARPRQQRRRRAAPRRSPDTVALRGIQQGVGRAVARAFGAAPLRRRRAGRRGRKGGMGYHPCLHDAFHQSHLPLPRPTGPYTTIRTTQLVTSGSGLIIFGPTFDRPKGIWTNHCAYAYNDFNSAGSASNNLKSYAFNTISGGSWNGAQVTPSAFSVQMMNPGAIQSTSGIIYAGRLRTSFKMSENSGTAGAALAALFISYNNPRLLSSAKLAFRGTQTDLVPFNMSELANFTKIEEETTGDFTGGVGMNDNQGFAPMFVYNPDGVNLQFLVCCEWRVRFDPSNPAQASHIQHTHAPESVWMQALHAAEALGNGVIDIADRVAATGNAVFGAAASTYRAGRGVRAITNGVGALALGM